MNTEEFIGLVFMPNQSLYYLLLLFSIIVYAIIYRKYYISIIDPSFLEVINSMFGFSVVLLLWFTDNMSLYYFSNYLTSQIAFWAGFIYISKRGSSLSDSMIKVTDEKNMLKCIFFISLIFYIATTILGYIVLGIPILAESRLDITANAQNGMGVLSRFSYLSIICIYCTLHFRLLKSRDRIIKIMQIATILFFCVTSILTGSKSAFLKLAFVYFCFVILNREYDKKLYKSLKNTQLYFMCLGVLAAFFIIVITTEGNIWSSISVFLLRLIGNGDVYWLGYPNGVVEDIPYKNPFVVLFQSFLGFFRIVPHADFPEPIGYTLSSFFYDKTSLTGANARHNIFGYVYFGFYGSIVFSFILGWIIGYIRNLFVNMKKYSVTFKIIVLLLYISVFSLECDPTLYLSYLTDILVTLPIILILSIILYLNNVSSRNFISNVQ